ncbi:MAG: MBL fold metallo-hydrolase [Cytophagales bacterium]|nr:MBL fold metallo-hydrolase [Cytophagales bacterium]
MTIKALVFSPFYENTYIISDEDNQAIIVDPGCYEPYEEMQLKQYIKENELQVKLILNTHCHIDHVTGNYFAKNEYQVPLWIPKGEKDIFEAVPSYSASYGFTNYVQADVDKYIGTDPIEVGKLKFEVRLAPGHSPGHLVFYNAEAKALIGGDVLFRDSIGRTDLPGGNHQQLLESIRREVFTLPDDTTVHSGHGPTTNIGYEKTHNPFVKNL